MASYDLELLITPCVRLILHFLGATGLYRHHEHIIGFIGGFEQNRKQYLLFQWANGGNLKDFWIEHYWQLCPELIEWALKQARGLADGLTKLHAFDDQRNYRHGDLRPENIVISTEPGMLGRLLITDLGLAKVHSISTGLRQTPTPSFNGDFRYQPPEVQRSHSRNGCNRTMSGPLDVSCSSLSSGSYMVGTASKIFRSLLKAPSIALPWMVSVSKPASNPGSSFSRKAHSASQMTVV